MTPLSASSNCGCSVRRLDRHAGRSDLSCFSGHVLSGPRRPYERFYSFPRLGARSTHRRRIRKRFNQRVETPPPIMPLLKHMRYGGGGSGRWGGKTVDYGSLGRYIAHLAHRHKRYDTPPPAAVSIAHGKISSRADPRGGRRRREDNPRPGTNLRSIGPPGCLHRAPGRGD